MLIYLSLVRSRFNRGSRIVIPSSVHDTGTAHKGAERLRLLLLSVGNKSSLRVAERASVSRGREINNIRAITNALPAGQMSHAMPPSTIQLLRGVSVSDWLTAYETGNEISFPCRRVLAMKMYPTTQHSMLGN